LVLSFQWDQPNFSVSGGAGCANEVDIYVLNAAGNQVVGGSAALNQGGDAINVFSFSNGGAAAVNLNLMIAQDTSLGGPTPTFLKYVVFVSMIINKFATNSGASYGHTTAAGGSGVGAGGWFQTPAFGVSPPVLEGFSSAGLTRILFTTAGAATFQLRQQPE